MMRLKERSKFLIMRIALEKCAMVSWLRRVYSSLHKQLL